MHVWWIGNIFLCNIKTIQDIIKFIYGLGVGISTIKKFTSGRGRKRTYFENYTSETTKD
jgi:hypothetical protein